MDIIYFDLNCNIWFSTIFSFSVEVAVIDEIQMVRDQGRGWAWTRALLGLMAEEIHVCGEEGAVELINALMCTTGEDVEVALIARQNDNSYYPETSS